MPAEFVVIDQQTLEEFEARARDDWRRRHGCEPRESHIQMLVSVEKLCRTCDRVVAANPERSPGASLALIQGGRDDA